MRATTSDFWGDVPGSLMVTGTPGQVKDYVKGLIDDFGDTGGLIIDGANSITEEARPENVMALREAVDEYGSPLRVQYGEPGRVEPKTTAGGAP